jgi:hypothetical protein
VEQRSDEWTNLEVHIQVSRGVLSGSVSRDRYVRGKHVRQYLLNHIRLGPDLALDSEQATLEAFEDLLNRWRAGEGSRPR